MKKKTAKKAQKIANKKKTKTGLVFRFNWIQWCSSLRRKTRVKLLMQRAHWALRIFVALNVVAKVVFYVLLLWIVFTFNGKIKSGWCALVYVCLCINRSWLMVHIWALKQFYPIHTRLQSASKLKFTISRSNWRIFCIIMIRFFFFSVFCFFVADCNLF